MIDDKKQTLLKYVPLICGIVAIIATLIPPLAIIIAVAGQVAGFYYRYNYQKETVVTVGLIMCAVYLASVILFGIFYGMFVGLANQLMKR